MGKWQEIWRNEGGNRLWRVPDFQVAELAQSWADDGKISRVLDLGCGIGRHVLLFARKGFEVYGSDHSEAGIKACKEWIRDERLGAEIWCGEPEDIPYPDGFFDAIIAFNSIYHGTGDQVASIIKLLHSKLRLGGRCFVTLLSRENRMYGKGKALEPHTFVSEGMFHKLFTHGGERGVPHHFSSKAEVLKLFDDFKLESLRHEELQLPSSHSGDGFTWFKIPKAYFWRVVVTKG